MNVQFLITLPTSKACNSRYMQDYFKRVFCFVFFGSYIFISDTMLMLEAIEIETDFFHSLGIPKARTLDYFFMLYTFVITSPTK